MIDFEELKIKTYDLWDLFLHERQFPYPGRAYAWARREGADLVSDMTREERDELFDLVIPEWESAVGELFNPTRTNIAILGNTSPHLHAHLIPRYQKPRTIGDVVFTDPNPTGNYAPYPEKYLDKSLILSIKERIGEVI